MTEQPDCVTCPTYRLFDWLALRFENRWYDQHVSVLQSELECKQRLDQVWSLIHALLANRENGPAIADCLIIAWPDPSKPYDQARWCYGSYEDKKTFGPEDASDAWEVVRAWCEPDASHLDVPWIRDERDSKFLACYFAYSAREYALEKSRLRVEHVLHRPIFKCLPVAPHLVELTPEGLRIPTTIAAAQKQIPPTDASLTDFRYYQQLAFGFTRRHAGANNLARVIPHAVAAAVYDWSYDLEKTQSKREGQIRTQEKFAHQTSSMLGTVWLDEKRTELSELTQFTLWMSVQMIQRVWGSVSFDPDARIDEDFPEWANEETETIFEKLVRAGIRHGLQRAAARLRRTASANSIEELDHLYWRVYTAANGIIDKSPEHLLDSEDWYSATLRVLRFKRKQGPPPEYTRLRGFALAFHHALWQATYHAFTAAVDITGHEGHPTNEYLVVEWDDKSLSVRNRESDHISRFVAEEHRRSSKDRDYFNLIENKMANYSSTRTSEAPLFTIKGPEPSKPDGWWSVSIAYHPTKGHKT